MKFNRVFAIVLAACGQYRMHRFTVICGNRHGLSEEVHERSRFWEVELAFPLLMRTHDGIRYCLCVCSTSSCVNASGALARYLVREKWLINVGTVNRYWFNRWVKTQANMTNVCRSSTLSLSLSFSLCSFSHNIYYASVILNKISLIIIL